MKIKTDVVLNDLNGEPLKEGGFTLGKVIANILVSAKHDDKLKLYVLGTKFYKEEEVDLDASDMKLVESLVKDCQIYSALIVGQVQLMLSELKDAQKESKKEKEE